MELLDDVLQDWRSCRPEGVVLRAEHLGRIIDCVAARVQKTAAPFAARRRALELLAPADVDGGLPQLVRQLRVQGGYRHTGGALGDVAGVPVVHFLCFWQALREVWRRLGRMGRDGASSEPIAAELDALRDALIANWEQGTLTVSVMSAKVAMARKYSADPSAWEIPEAALAHAATAAAVALHSSKQPPPAQGEELMPLDQVSTLLMMWLSELTEDYCRGSRADSIRAVRDVLGCTIRDAATHLGASGWDVEAALRRSYVDGPALAASDAVCLNRAWSSANAKLRASELQCPICVESFSGAAESVVTRCCFQVICEHCASFMTSEEGLLCCPFCRQAMEPPTHPSAARAGPEGRAPAVQWPSQLMGDRLKGLLIQGCSVGAHRAARVAEELMSAVRGAESPQHAAPPVMYDYFFEAEAA